MKRSIGIIGGTGTIGSVFAKKLAECGYPVTVSDESTPAAEEVILQSADIIVLAVPMSESQNVIRRIRPYLRADVIFTDFNSVKSTLADTLRTLPCRVVSSHPLFGYVSSMTGQNIVLIPVCAAPNDTDKASELRRSVAVLHEIWEELGLSVTELASLETHDKCMSQIQGLMHFMHIAFVSTLRTFGTDVQQLIAISSPVYISNFAFACRILAGSPELYTDIIMTNPENAVVIETMQQVFSEMSRQLTAGDRPGFIENFKAGQAFLGSKTLNEFREESDTLVAALTDQLLKSRGGTQETGD